MCSRGAPKGREYVRYALLRKSYRSTAGQASQKSNECHVEMMRLGPFIGWGVGCWIRLDIGPTLVAHNRNLLHLRSRTGEPFSEVRTALVMLNMQGGEMQGGEMGEAEAIARLSLMRYFLFTLHGWMKIVYIKIFKWIRPMHKVSSPFNHSNHLIKDLQVQRLYRLSEIQVQRFYRSSKMHFFCTSIQQFNYIDWA